MSQESSRGFTLIELLIVVVVIAILAGIAIARFNNVRERAFRSAMVSDLRRLSNRQEVHHGNTYSYSTSLTAMGLVETESVFLTVNEANQTGWGATASHAGLPGRQCGIYYGSATAASGSPAPGAGVVACDF